MNSKEDAAYRLRLAEGFLKEAEDESNRKVPWQIYGEEEAKEAIQIARRCFEVTKRVHTFYQRREENHENKTSN